MQRNQEEMIGGIKLFITVRIGENETWNDLPVSKWTRSASTSVVSGCLGGPVSSTVFYEKTMTLMVHVCSESYELFDVD